MHEWVKEIRVDDLPEVYQTVAEAIGLDSAIKLSETLGGTSYYFPKLDKLMAAIRDKKIKEEFTGYNHKALATKYSLSEIWIRRIVNGGDERQERLFP